MDLKGVGQSIVNFVMEIPYHVTSMIDEIRFSVLDPESKQAINLQAIQILNGMRTNKGTKKEIEKAVKHAVFDVAQAQKIQEIRKKNSLDPSFDLNDTLNHIMMKSDSFSKILMAKIPPRIQAIVTDFNELNTPVVLNESPDFQNKLNRFREVVENGSNKDYSEARQYLKDPFIQELAQNYSAQLQGTKTKQELLDLFVSMKKDIIHELHQRNINDVNANILRSILLASILNMNNSKVKHAIDSLDPFFQTYDNPLVEMSNNYVSAHGSLNHVISEIDEGPIENMGTNVESLGS